MSTIYFHSEHGTMAIRGSERAWAGVLCMDLMGAVIGDHPQEWIMPLIPADSYGAKVADGVKSWLRSSSGHLLIEGRPVENWIISLNTAMALGNDAVRLLARLHGQCEIHCYVEGHNRAWLAKVIRQGRRAHVLRDRQGWDELAAFLDDRADAPVVCSYSVCDSFPAIYCLPEDHALNNKEDEGRWDKFHELPDAEQWALCMQGLRERDPMLEMKPGNWRNYKFAKGESAFMLRDFAELAKAPGAVALR